MKRSRDNNRRKLKGITYSLFIVTLSIIFCLIFLVCLWMIILHLYFSACLALALALLFIPIRLKNSFWWLYRMAFFIIIIIIVLGTVHVSIGEINNRIAHMAGKPRSKDTLHLFSFRDKLGIYGLNLMMGISAYPIYPEISMETLLMVLPPPENGIRSFHSNFAINSREVRNVVREFNKTLSFTEDNEVSFQRRIYWNIGEYTLGSKEARYALALNPADVFLHGFREDGKWYIDISLKVQCRYPQNSSVVLISSPELRIEEGLFWVLQEVGWLYPYTAEWRFGIRSSDRRIN